jgi:preprotein translocase subunit SecY
VDSLRNLFAIPDLRNRVLFTLGMLAVYRIGAFIPTPGVNPAALAEMARQLQNTMFGLYDMFTGGQLSQITIFALGVMPYISSSIILQLLTVVWPYLERLSKEGELGRRKITQYTRYLTLVLAVVQSLGIAIWLERNTEIAGGLPLVYDPGWGFRFVCVLTLTTGTMFIMWLGEQITERGIGNGMSLIIFAGIVVNFPRSVLQTFELMETGQITLLRMIILAVLMVGVVAAIIYVERGHRRITVQYAKRVVGRRHQHPHPAQGQHRRCDSGDFRVVHPGVSSDARPDVRCRRLGRRHCAAAEFQHAALQPVVCGVDSVLRVLLHGDHLQPG